MKALKVLKKLSVCLFVCLSVKLTLIEMQTHLKREETDQLRAKVGLRNAWIAIFLSREKFIIFFFIFPEKLFGNPKSKLFYKKKLIQTLQPPPPPMDTYACFISIKMLSKVL